MISLFLAALLSLSAFADPDPDPDFVAPPASFTNTKYSQDCGGDTPDLKPDLPPMDDQYDQKNSPWCVSFNAKLMLEYKNHLDHPGDSYKTRYSVVDINSKDALNVLNFGKQPNLAEGTEIASLLSGVIESGELYQQKDRPFDPVIFNPGNLVEQLTSYYKTQRPYANLNALQCRDQSPPFQRLEKDFGSLLSAIRDSKTLTDFLDEATGANPVAPQTKAGAKPLSVKPLEFRQYGASNGDQFVEELRQALKNHAPVSLSLCALPLQKIPGLGNGEQIPPARKNKCGPHAIMATRLVSVGGKCMVELRNSWGKGWPPAGANGSANPRGQGGYGMISLDELLGITLLHGNQSLMTSLKPAAETKGTGNTLENGDGWVFEGSVLGSRPYDGKFTGKMRDQNFFYDGEMKKGRPSGKGHLIADDGTDQNGTFLDGKFVEGTYKGAIGSDGATYEGGLKNSFPEGQGTLKGADGSVSSGIFDKGVFKEGSHKGPWNEHAIYDGEVRNGLFNGKGKLLREDGTEMEGEFKDGGILNGRYDGPWNGDPKRIYHGPIVNGRTTSAGKWSSPPASLSP